MMKVRIIGRLGGDEMPTSQQAHISYKEAWNRMIEKHKTRQWSRSPNPMKKHGKVKVYTKEEIAMVEKSTKVKK